MSFKKKKKKRMKKQGSFFSGGCYKMVACRNISNYLRHGAGQSRQSLIRAFLTLVLMLHTIQEKLCNRVPLSLDLFAK